MENENLMETGAEMKLVETTMRSMLGSMLRKLNSYDQELFERILSDPEIVQPLALFNERILELRTSNDVNKNGLLNGVEGMFDTIIKGLGLNPETVHEALTNPDPKVLESVSKINEMLLDKQRKFDVSGFTASLMDASVQSEDISNKAVAVNVIEPDITVSKISSFASMSLDELKVELYNYPINSDEHFVIREEITKKLTDPKYDEYVIAFKSRMNSWFHSDEFRLLLTELNDVDGIAAYPNEFSNQVYFSNTMSFPEDSRFTYMKRKHLEYNPEYKQLVVAAYITDGNRVILLDTNGSSENRIQNKYTMVQGHVDFGPEAYITSQLEFLSRNLEREFREEVKYDGELTFDITPKFLINDRKNHVGLEHFGVVFEFKVPDCTGLFYKLSSGEENKHNIKLLDFMMYDSFRHQLDDWSKLVLDRVSKN